MIDLSLKKIVIIGYSFLNLLNNQTFNLNFCCLTYILLNLISDLYSKVYKCLKIYSSIAWIDEIGPPNRNRATIKSDFKIMFDLIYD